MKRSSIIGLLIFTFLLGNAFSSNSVLAADTVQSLKKQVLQLQAQVKALTSKVTSKDKEIAILKKENATLKANAATVSKTKVSYKGLAKTGVITYKNSDYIPVSFVKDVFEIPVTYDRKTDITYVGVKPDGLYMSDIMKPYDGALEVNSKIRMAGETYYKTYRAYHGDDTSAYFNLNKKYTSLRGKIGFDEGTNTKRVQVQILGDGEILTDFELHIGDLPQDINLDVTNVKQLQFKLSSTAWGYSYVDFADFIIK